MKKKFYLIFVLTIFSCPFYVLGQEKETEFNLKQYFFVMLTRGSNAEKIDSLKLMEIQKGHLANIIKIS